MILVSTLVLASAAGLTQAQGNAAAGESKAVVCGACHGANGNSTIGENPKLAGQNVRYLAKQMHDIKSGARANGQSAAMKGVMELVNDEEIKALATYISTMK